MIEKAQEALKLGITEIHIVGGLHPSFKWDYYVEMLRGLKKLDANLHLKDSRRSKSCICRGSASAAAGDARGTA